MIGRHLRNINLFLNLIYKQTKTGMNLDSDNIIIQFNDAYF